MLLNITIKEYYSKHIFRFKDTKANKYKEKSLEPNTSISNLYTAFFILYNKKTCKLKSKWSKQNHGQGTIRYHKKNDNVDTYTFCIFLVLKSYLKKVYFHNGVLKHLSASITKSFFNVMCIHFIIFFMNNLWTV